jgi:hypothetical protein
VANEHLLNPRRYAARFGVPSVSMEEPSFRPGFNAYRTWRGAAWVNTAWLLIGGLRSLGAGDEADRIAAGRRRRRRAQRLSASTTTRAPAPAHGEHRFGWSTLLLDLPRGFSVPSPGVAPRA